MYWLIYIKHFNGKIPNFKVLVGFLVTIYYVMDKLDGGKSSVEHFKVY